MSTAAGSVRDVHVFSELDMHRSEPYALAGGHAVVYTSRAPDKDTPNEDCAALIAVGEQAGVLIVADGLGGLPAGEQASRLAVDTLVGSIGEAARQGQSLREAILNGIEQANRTVMGRGGGGATTLALVEIDGTVIRSYHIGDSMILVTGQRGRIKQQTVSHSPVGYAVESGLIDEDEAVHHEERHVVSNVIGFADMRIELGPHLKLAQRDTLILASDGLFDNFYVEEIVERSRKGALPACADELARSAQQRMRAPASGLPSKPDDMTFILFRRM